MVPKDELFKIHKKIIQIPLKLAIQKDLSTSKKHLDSYLKNSDVWFEGVKGDVIDKNKFIEFLDFFKKNTLELFPKIDNEMKIKVKSISKEFLKNLEEHCSYTLKLKLKYIEDSIIEENETGANFKRLGRILVPIIIILFVLGILIGGLFFIINLSSDSDEEVKFGLDENLSQGLDQIGNLSLNSSSDNIDADEILDNYVDSSDVSDLNDGLSQENYELSQVEKELFDIINVQRVKYYKGELMINLELSTLLRNHTYEMSKTYEISNEDQYGGMGDRAEQVNVTAPVRESNVYYQYSSGVLSDLLFEKVKNDNLFLEEHTHMAIGITEGEFSTYFVTIDTY